MRPNDNSMLIVENDPLDAKLIVRASKKARPLNSVHIVNDRVEAIRCLDGQPPFNNRAKYSLPGVILMDLTMPKKDGFEVLQWLSSQPELKRLPVVVLTASGELSDVNRAYDLGANSYMVKPVGADILVDMLKKVELYWMVTNIDPDLETD